MTRYGSNCFKKTPWSKKDYKDNFRILYKLEQELLAKDKLNLLTDQVLQVKQLGWAMTIVPKRGDLLRDMTYLSDYDLEIQRKFSGLNKHLIPVANIARRHQVNGQFSASYRYFQLAINISKFIDPSLIHNSSAPKLELVSLNGVINELTKKELQDLYNRENLNNLGGFCVETLRRLFELYGHTIERNQKHEPTNFKVGLETTINFIQKLRKKGEPPALIASWNQSE